MITHITDYINDYSYSRLIHVLLILLIKLPSTHITDYWGMSGRDIMMRFLPSFQVCCAYEVAYATYELACATACNDQRPPLLAGRFRV